MRGKCEIRNPSLEFRNNFESAMGRHMTTRKFEDAFARLSAAESRFPGTEFLAPALVGGEVRVRIAGVVCTLHVTPADFEGWGIFRAGSHAAAELVREAGLAERQRYLRLFPVVRLILCTRDAGTAHRPHWWGTAAHQGDSRFRISGMVPVRLAEDVQQFDVVRARFDGSSFWFDDLDPARSPATADFLRKSLKQTIEPNRLQRPGLTPEERAAYAVNYFAKAEVRKQLEADRTETRLREALEHAGAEFVDFLERRDSYRVTYAIGGRQHVSAVNKNDLTVQVAGICLAGQDRRFDLASLVGVIREGEAGGEIVPVGRDNAGMQEDQYWDAHPPNA